MILKPRYEFSSTIQGSFPGYDQAIRRSCRRLFEDILRRYYNGTLDDRLLNPSDQKVYRYAQERKAFLEDRVASRRQVTFAPITIPNRLLHPPTPAFANREEIEALSIPQLKDWLDRNGINYTGVRRKSELVDLVEQTMLWIPEVTLLRDVPLVRPQRGNY